MTLRITRVLILILLVSLSTKAFASSTFNLDDYRSLDNYALTDDDKLDFLVHENDFNVSKDNKVKISINAADLFVKKTIFPTSLKISIYKINNNQELWLENISRTITSAKKAERLSFSFDLSQYMTSSEEEFVFKVFAEDGLMVGEFSDFFIADDFDAATNNFHYLSAAKCDDEAESFGNCQMDHFFRNLSIKLTPKTKTETKLKKQEGHYQLEIPAIANKKYRRASRRRSSYNTARSSNKTNTTQKDDKTEGVISLVDAPESVSAEFVKAKPLSKFSVNEGTHQFNSTKKTFFAGDSFNTSSAGKYSVLFGRNSFVYGDYNMVSGLDNDIYGQYDVSFGEENINYGSYTVLAGARNTNEGTYNFIAGVGNRAGTKAYGAFATGFNNVLNGNYSTVLGTNSVMSGYGSMSFGHLLNVQGDKSIIVGSGENGTPYVNAENEVFIIVHEGEEVMAVRGPKPSFPNGIVGITGSLHANGGFAGNANGVTAILAANISGLFEPGQGGTGYINSGYHSWGNSNISFVGNHNITMRVSEPTDLTLPVNGTLITEDGVETISNKIFLGGTLNGVHITTATVSDFDFGSGGYIEGNVSYSGTQTYNNSVSVGGNFTLNDGSQQDGYVLTTDANGNASWVDVASLINNVIQGATAIAAGEQFEIQFNLHDRLAADADLTFKDDTLSSSALVVTNKFTYQDGNESVDRVLAAAVNGESYWQDFSSLVTGKAAGDNGHVQFNTDDAFSADIDLYFTEGSLIANAMSYKEIQENLVSASYGLDWTDGNQQIIKMVANTIDLTVTKNPAGACTVLLQINHNANSGTKTINWPSNFLFDTDGTPRLTTEPSAVDFVTCLYNPNHGASGSYFCQPSYNFF